MEYKEGDIVRGGWGNRLYDERGETSMGYGILKILGRPVSGKGYPVAKVDRFGDTTTGRIGYVAKKDIERKAIPTVAYRYS